MPGLGQKAAGAMFWNFAGKLYFMLGKYAESVILIRLLGAEEYGAMGAALSVEAMAVMFVSLGMNNTILKFLPQVREQGAAERPFLRRVILWRFLLSVAAAAIIALLAPFFAERFIHDRARTGLFYAVALLVVGTGLQNLISRILVSRYRQKALNLIQSIVLTVYLALSVCAILLGFGVTGVLFANAVTALGGAILVWIKSGGANEAPAGPDAGAGPSFARMARFSITFFFYDLLNFVLEKPLDVMLLGLLQPDLKQVAYYVLAYNFATFSMSIFTKVFAEGFTLSLAADVYAAGDWPRLHKIYGALMEYMYLFIIPVVAGGLVIGDDLIRVMYGREGEGAVGPAIFFLVVTAFGKYQGITANFLGAMDRERALIVSRAIFAALNAGLNVLLIPLYGAWGAIIGTSIATFAGLAYEAVLLHRAMKPVFPVRFMIRVGAASALMGACVFAAVRFLPDSALVRVAVGLPLGGAVYLAGLMALKPISPHLLDVIQQTKAPGARFAVRLLMPRERENSP